MKFHRISNDVEAVSGRDLIAYSRDPARYTGPKPSWIGDCEIREEIHGTSDPTTSSGTAHVSPFTNLQRALL